MIFLDSATNPDWMRGWLPELSPRIGPREIWFSASNL
jgi:hypothetical protein